MVGSGAGPARYGILLKYQPSLAISIGVLLVGNHYVVVLGMEWAVVILV